jgi:hypothetical protein
MAVVTVMQVLDAGARASNLGAASRQNHPSPAPAIGWTRSDNGRADSVPVTLSAHIGYGLNVRDPANLDSLFSPLGFEWVKLYEQYDALPIERLPYKVLYRIQLNGLPISITAWGDHVSAIAQAGKGLVEAYEIGNEPNQSWQWGNQVPDPDEFVGALKVAYARIKAEDPDAVIVSGGLGPVGRIEATPEGEGWPGNDGRSMDEWEYAKAMFTQCITGCFDVLGYHPFGFAYPPETDPNSVPNNFAFRGAEDIRQIMLTYGLDDKPVWATEFGWIRDPDADGWGGCKFQPDFNEPFGWMLVSALQQADYLSRSYAYADAHWPWMEAMFVWNLDWNDQGWTCDNIRFFSLRYVSGDAAPAYDALAAMDKRPGPVGCRLMIEPNRTAYLTDVDHPLLITETINVGDMDGCDSVTWTVTLDPSSTLQPNLIVTQGRFGFPMTFAVDTGAHVTQGTDVALLYPTGTYTAHLRFSTLPSDVIGSPQIIPLVLLVADDADWIYMPILAKE